MPKPSPHKTRLNGEEKNCYPDFITRINASSASSPQRGEDRGLPSNDSIEGEGESRELDLIIEVTGGPVAPVKIDEGKALAGAVKKYPGL